MTKRELVKWLEHKEELSLNTVAEQYNTAMKNYEEQRNESLQLTEVSEKISSYISQAYDILAELKDSCKEKGITIQAGYYSSVESKLLGMYKASDVKHSLISCMEDRSDARKALVDKKNNLISSIKKNYQNVIANVQNIKTAKLAVEYLVNEVGFTQKEIDEYFGAANSCTTLVCQVDSKFLFIGNSPKDNNKDSGDDK